MAIFTTTKDSMEGAIGTPSKNYECGVKETDRNAEVDTTVETDYACNKTQVSVLKITRRSHDNQFT